jgi:hypothetical protein
MPKCVVKALPLHLQPSSQWAKARREGTTKTDTWNKEPEWAIKLIQKECKVRSLTFVWHNASRKASSGRAYSNFCKQTYGDRTWVGPTLTITAGTDEEGQKHVLLHEIAHFNVGIGHKHDAVFIAEVIRLYRKYDLLEATATGKHWEYPTVAKACVKAWNRTVAARKIPKKVA